MMEKLEALKGIHIIVKTRLKKKLNEYISLVVIKKKLVFHFFSS